jgi:hypothetical protein
MKNSTNIDDGDMEDGRLKGTLIESRRREAPLASLGS